MKPHPLLVLGLAAFAAGSVAMAKPKPAPVAALGEPTDADFRPADPQNTLVIQTNKGQIIVELQPLAAPNTVARVLQLARQGVYDGRSFFRVIDNFMDQTGDPLDSGVGASSLPNVGPEFNFKRGADTPFVMLAKQGGQEQGFIGSLPVISQTMDLALLTLDHKVQAWGSYCPGVLGFARSEDPNSGNSQFFLMRTDGQTGDHGTHALDQKYTAFGRVIAGQDVVDAIKTGEPVAAPQDRMLVVKVLADLPDAQRPKVRVIDAASAWMKAEVAQEQADNPGEFTVCDVRTPVRLEAAAQPIPIPPPSPPPVQPAGPPAPAGTAGTPAAAPPPASGSQP
jgi:peptidylprolyl isomerase